MRVIAKRTLRKFWETRGHTDSKGPLESWHAEAVKSDWTSPQDIKGQFRNASILKNNRVVFNVGGNKYRLIVSIDYIRKVLFVKFIGTHRQYDKIDVESI